MSHKCVCVYEDRRTQCLQCVNKGALGFLYSVLEHFVKPECMRIRIILKTAFSFTESALLAIVFSAGGLQPQDQRTLGEEAFREGRG